MYKFVGTLFTLLLASSCAMLREGNPVLTPSSAEYPCGPVGDICEDATSPEEKCCLVGKCARNGADAYCDLRGPSDPGDPTTWDKRQRANRTHVASD